MDPATVIVVLATHLICTGGLLALVARQMPPRCGLLPWAAGLVLFGGAYLVRLAAGTTSHSWWLLGPDVAMMAAALLFIVGLREFVGADGWQARRAVAVLAVFVLAEAGVMAVWGAHGRHTVLNLGLGFTYAWLAANAAAVGRAAEPPLRRPLAFLAGLMGLLAALTMARGLNIARHGLDVVLGGTFAKVYYGYASLAAVLLAMGLMWMVFVRLTNQLAELATRDALTRVLNRTGLDDALRRHYGARPQQPLVLLAVDVDHFKRINDEHGHASGDRVLAAVAAVLTRHLRPSDLVARIGGEEFVVCTAASRDAALQLAERLRSAVAALQVDTAGTRLSCTVSVGVSAPCPDLAGWDTALGNADRALYAAKSAGRDRVVAA